MIVIGKDSLWIEKNSLHGQADIVEVFDVSPPYLANRSVAFTIIDGRNAKPASDNRRMFTVEAFLERFIPFTYPPHDVFISYSQNDDGIQVYCRTCGTTALVGQFPTVEEVKEAVESLQHKRTRR